MYALLLYALLTPADEPVLTLPDGPVAKVWAGVGVETQPAQLPAGIGERSWDEAATWQRWAELVALEARAQKPDPARRAELCLLARAHGRAEDAWQHYRELGAHPSWVAAVTPFLLPGVPGGSRIEAGGLAAPLKEGVLLAPFLPPATRSGLAGQVEWRSATAHRLRIGEGVIDVTITVEATGVQVDLAHVEGEAVELNVLLPEPEGFEIRIEYVDWMRREDSERRTPIPLRILPGEEPHQLFGRLLEGRSNLPTGKAVGLPALIREQGLTFLVPEEEDTYELTSRIAAVIGELLGVPERVRTVRVHPQEQPGIVFRLMQQPGSKGGQEHGRVRLERLRYLASALEAFLLERE